MRKWAVLGVAAMLWGCNGTDPDVEAAVENWKVIEGPASDFCNKIMRPEGKPIMWLAYLSITDSVNGGRITPIDILYYENLPGTGSGFSLPNCQLDPNWTKITVYYK